jgi:hypothetical protein
MKPEGYEMVPIPTASQKLVLRTNIIPRFALTFTIKQNQSETDLFRVLCVKKGIVFNSINDFQDFTQQSSRLLVSSLFSCIFPSCYKQKVLEKKIVPRISGASNMYIVYA